MADRARREQTEPPDFRSYFANRALSAAETMDRFFRSILDGDRSSRRASSDSSQAPQPSPDHASEGGRHDR